MGDPRVPYEKIARAELDARTQYPDATRVTGLWTPASACEITVEVWRDDRATVQGWNPSR